MSFATEPKNLLQCVQKLVDDSGSCNRPTSYPFFYLNLIYRMLGSPRAWQLGGEQALRQLKPDILNAVIDWSAAVLGERNEDGTESLKPNQRYLYSHEPPITISGDVPELDLFDVELVEKTFWPVTIPIEFVRAVARLGEKDQ